MVSDHIHAYALQKSKIFKIWISRSFFFLSLLSYLTPLFCYFSFLKNYIYVFIVHNSKSHFNIICIAQHEYNWRSTVVSRHLITGPCKPKSCGHSDIMSTDVTRGVFELMWQSGIWATGYTTINYNWVCLGERDRSQPIYIEKQLHSQCIRATLPILYTWKTSTDTKGHTLLTWYLM